MITMLLLLAFVTIGVGVTLFLAVVCLQVVNARQALIIYDHATGSVRSVTEGPARVLALPFIDEMLRLDLTPQKATLTIADATTSDCLPIQATVDIFYTIDPDLLKTGALSKLLPFFGKIDAIVESWAVFILRALVSGSTSADVLSNAQVRGRMERLLANTLQTNVQKLGVRVSTVRLLFRPAPEMVHAYMGAHIQAQTLAALAKVLGPEYTQSLGHILPLGLLGGTLPNELQMLAALSFLQPAVVSGNGHGNGHTSPVIHWVLDAH